MEAMQSIVRQSPNPSAVQGTNDSSIVSKLSMSDAGYFIDPYLKDFVSKRSRRAPLINRGYYVRAKAVDHVLTSFLSHFSSMPVQIISLGAGFDSSYFRLMAQGKLGKLCRFFEVDFPSTVDRKVPLIYSSAALLSMISNATQRGPHIFESTMYTLIGCDLSHLLELARLLELCSVDYNVPTLLLSECVLTYMEPARVDDLLSWSARSFRNAMFCTYEQIHPDDPFGLIMQQHFLSLHSPLRNINQHPTKESQEKRYKQAGWSECVSCTMNDFFSNVSMEEQQRVNSLELFDEFEGWHLKCSHYIMLCAFQGVCTTLGKELLPSEVDACEPWKESQIELDLGPAALCNGVMLLSRFAHCSAQLISGEIIVAGGFGCPGEFGPHTRLEDVVLLRTVSRVGEERKWECVALETIGNGPGKLMYQTATLIPSLDIILFYGGRGSPAKACGSCYSLQPSDTYALWKEVELDSASQVPEPRWRHTATLVSSRGIETVIIAGGRSTSQQALNDCYILNTTTWMFQRLDVTLPEGRHSHCAEPYNNTVIIAGGMDCSMQPLSTCLQLQFLEGGKWTVTPLEFEEPLPARYSMASCIRGDLLWLLGGVQLMSTYAGLLKVDLLGRKWVECRVKSAAKGHPVLLHGHTCCIADGDLFVLGGGGSCFSFGTQINNSVCISLDRF